MKPDNDDVENTETFTPADERAPERKGDLEARPDELGTDPSQVGALSAGQTVGSQGLSPVPEVSEQSVQALADTDQALEAGAVEGIEDAADHPERPTHTHEEYGRLDEIPPPRRDEETA